MSLCIAATARDGARAGELELVSRAAPDLQVDTAGGDSGVYQQALSADGRYIAYGSGAANLVPRQVNSPYGQVFLFDRSTRTNTLISHRSGSPRSVPDSASYVPRIAANGRYVLFTSTASNLVHSQVGGSGIPNIYQWDRVTDTTVLVSHAAGLPTTVGDGYSTDTAMSADGRFIAFISTSTNLVAGVSYAPGANVFLWDRVTGTTALVSEQAGVLFVNAVSISADGAWLAFQRFDSDPTVGNVFVFSRITGATTLVSHAAGLPNQAGNATSYSPVISADGSGIAFSSGATDLIAGETDANDADDVFLYDRIAGTTVLVSHTASSPITAGNSTSGQPVLSANSRFVAFQSTAGDLVAGQTGDQQGNIFLYDALSGTSALVSGSAAAPATDSRSGLSPAMDASGRFVAFASSAGDLVSSQSGGAGANNIFLFDSATGSKALVSRSSASATAGGNGSADGPVAVSAGGDFVAFNSSATDLEAGVQDGNFATDVFLYDRAAASVETVTLRDPHNPSRSSGGFAPAISAEGRYVPYLGVARGASGLVTALLLFDRKAKTSTLISHLGSDRTIASASLTAPPAISADGRYVAFDSTGSDLIAGGTDGNNETDVFSWDRETGVVSLVSHAAGSPATAGDSFSNSPSISNDGRFVAFLSAASNLVAGQQGQAGSIQVFLWDRQSGATVLVSHATGEAVAAGDGNADSVLMSPDGRFVAFASEASNLVPGQISPPFSGPNIFLFDRISGATVLVSHTPGAPTTGGNNVSNPPAIGPNGDFVAFVSFSTDLVPGQVDANGGGNVFLWERATGTVTMLSRAAGTAATGGDGTSDTPAVAADGSVVFSSLASNLVAGQDDTDATGGNVFLYDHSSGAVTMVSRLSGSAATAAGGGSGAISRDGGLIAFSSFGTGIVAGELVRLNSGNVYLLHRATGVVELVSRIADSPPTSGDGNSGPPILSPDAGCMVFESGATDLVKGVLDSHINVFLRCELTANDEE